MNDREALEILNMFTLATQIAKENNKVECKFELQEDAFIESFKKAFPHMKDSENVAKAVFRKSH